MKTPAERFDAKVQRGDGCWLWTASRGGNGYGQFWVQPTGPDRRKVNAHRFAWERQNGPVPPGLSVLHRCDNPLCVNPDHLFVGTPADNSRDMVAKGRNKSPFKAKDVCDRGHALTQGKAQRYCQICRREQDRARAVVRRRDPAYREKARLPAASWRRRKQQMDYARDEARDAIAKIRGETQ